MSEFERVKRVVGSANVVLTSWFDEGCQAWRASAPAYAHLSVVAGASRPTCPSRQAALDQVADTLMQHFTAREG